jgi:hypothetical protein
LSTACPPSCAVSRRHSLWPVLTERVGVRALEHRLSIVCRLAPLSSAHTTWQCRIRRRVAHEASGPWRVAHERCWRVAGEWPMRHAASNAPLLLSSACLVPALPSTFYCLPSTLYCLVPKKPPVPWPASTACRASTVQGPCCRLYREHRLPGVPTRYLGRAGPGILGVLKSRDSKTLVS